MSQASRVSPIRPHLQRPNTRVSSVGLVLERNVPLPRQRRGRECRYPFAEMEAGESVLITRDYASADGVRAALVPLQKKGQRFYTRTNSAGMRVWRTA